MTKISVDFGKIVGPIKPVNGVGQPPFSETDFSMVHYLKDAAIPYARLHDVGGRYGGDKYVDIPNVFRDFSADPEDPASYDFASTDLLIKALMDNGIEPVYRLGVTIENHSEYKSYRIYPPEDYEKWARICEGVIRHYNEGWANGFFYNIEYWEIWNEPDNEPDLLKNPMWRGTKQQYFELYKTAYRYLKKCFPKLKIGGYGSCGFYSVTNTYIAAANSSDRLEYFTEYFEDFLNFVKDNDCPPDFFSWHSYAYIEDTMEFARYARKKLDEFGFTHTETTCNEWNCEPDKGWTHHRGVLAAGMMLAMQNSCLDSAMFYDARCGSSAYAMFDGETREPFPVYYAFVAFKELAVRKNQVELKCDNKTIYAVAAYDTNGCIMIANPTDDNIKIELDIGDKSIISCKLFSEKSGYADSEFDGMLAADTVVCITVE